MNIFVLTATLNLNCFANKAEQMRKPLARAVIRAVNEYSHLAPLFLRAVKGRLPQSGETPPVVHALPQAVRVVTCSLLNSKVAGTRVRKQWVPAQRNDRPASNQSGWGNELGSAALKSKSKLVYNMSAQFAAPNA